MEFSRRLNNRSAQKAEEYGGTDENEWRIYIRSDSRHYSEMYDHAMRTISHDPKHATSNALKHIKGGGA